MYESGLRTDKASIDVIVVSEIQYLFIMPAMLTLSILPNSTRIYLHMLAQTMIYPIR